MVAPGPGRVVLDGGGFFESPRWHDRRLWVSDFYRHRVLAMVPGGSAEPVAEVPHQPSGLGWLPDGRLLVVSMRDRRLLRREESGALVEHADLSAFGADPLNDMVVDGAGRAWVGSLGSDLTNGAAIVPATLVRVEPDGTAAVAAEGLVVPNGAAFLDDATLVVAESFAQRLTAFTVRSDGSLGDRRIWAEFGPVRVGVAMATALSTPMVCPDGICADAEGAVWVADPAGCRVIRVQEGGAVRGEIRTPEGPAFACTLGGPDGRDLFVCVTPPSSRAGREQARLARVVAYRVAVPALAGR